MKRYLFLIKIVINPIGMIGGKTIIIKNNVFFHDETVSYTFTKQKTQKILQFEMFYKFCIFTTHEMLTILSFELFENIFVVLDVTCYI